MYGTLVSTELYAVTVVRVEDDRVLLDVKMTHPDECFFGLSKVFALRILCDLSNRARKPDKALSKAYDDKVAQKLADQIVKDFAWSKLKNIKSSEEVPGNLRIERDGRKTPNIHYVLSVTDAKWLKGLDELEDKTGLASYAYFHPPRLEEPAPAPKKSTPTKRTGRAVAPAWTVAKKDFKARLAIPSADGWLLVSSSQWTKVGSAGKPGSFARPPREVCARYRAVVVGSVLVIPNQGKHLAGYDLGTGRLIWDMKGPETNTEMTFAGPVLAKGHAISIHKDTLTAVAPLTGKVIWKRKLPEWKESGFLGTDGDRVFLQSHEPGFKPIRRGRLVALAAETGAVDWQIDGVTETQLGLDGSLFARFTEVPRTESATLAMLEPRTGERRWKQPARSRDSVVAVGEGLVVESDAGEVWAYNAKGGTIRWKQSHASYAQLILGDRVWLGGDETTESLALGGGEPVDLIPASGILFGFGNRLVILGDKVWAFDV